MINQDKLSYDEVYNLLLPIINNIYEEYSSINISNEAYNNTVKTLIQNFLENKENIQEGTIEEYFQKQLKVAMDEYASNLLNDKCLLIINNYIDNNIEATSDYMQALNELTKISTFLIPYIDIVSLDFMKKLVSDNKKVNHLLNNIIQSDLFESTELINILNRNSILLSLVESYNAQLDDDDIGSFVNDNDNLRSYIMDLYGASKPLTKEEEQALIIRIAQGDIEARNELIASHLKLVVKIARKYVNRGVDLLDLIQEGNMALIKAAEIYKPNMSLRFYTYASLNIYRNIIRAVDLQSESIKIPLYMRERLKSYQKVESALQTKLNRVPTISELAKELNMSEQNLIKLKRLPIEVINMDFNADYDNAYDVNEALISDDVQPDDIVISRELHDKVQQLLLQCNLSERERTIITLRFGLDGYGGRRLDEIAKEVGIARQSVHASIINILNKLRRNKNTKAFAIYMNNPTEALNKTKERLVSESKENIYISPTSNKITKPVNESLSKDSEEDITLAFPKEDNLSKKRQTSNIEIQLPKVTTKKPILRTIFDYFPTYNPQDIKSLMIKLGDERVQIINQVIKDNRAKWDIKLKFYTELVPLMTEFLESCVLIRNENSGRKLLTLYDYFPSYSREEVDLAIKRLSNKDQVALYRRYGGYLLTPIRNKDYTKNENDHFYKALLPRVSKLLNNSNLSGLCFPERNLPSVYDAFPEYDSESIDNVLEKLKDEDKAILRARYSEDYSHLQKCERKVAKKANYIMRAKVKKALEDDETLATGNNLVLKKNL